MLVKRDGGGGVRVAEDVAAAAAVVAAGEEGEGCTTGGCCAFGGGRIGLLRALLLALNHCKIFARRKLRAKWKIRYNIGIAKDAAMTKTRGSHKSVWEKTWCTGIARASRVGVPRSTNGTCEHVINVV